MTQDTNPPITPPADQPKPNLGSSTDFVESVFKRLEGTPLAIPVEVQEGFKKGTKIDLDLLINNLSQHVIDTKLSDSDFVKNLYDKNSKQLYAKHKAIAAQTFGLDPKAFEAEGDKEPSFEAVHAKIKEELTIRQQEAIAKGMPEAQKAYITELSTQVKMLENQRAQDLAEFSTALEAAKAEKTQVIINHAIEGTLNNWKQAGKFAVALGAFKDSLISRVNQRWLISNQNGKIVLTGKQNQYVKDGFTIDDAITTIFNDHKADYEGVLVVSNASKTRIDTSKQVIQNQPAPRRLNRLAQEELARQNAAR